MNSKRIIALISSIVLCCGTLVTPQVADIISNSIVASADNFTGSCGENATYFFNSSTGTLTISGTGYMTHRAFDNTSWHLNIKKVIINNGITTIGDYVFTCCESLVDIIIPNSVKRIGECAFENCTSLVDINIPNSVTSIGERAFENCISLVNINIPNSVTSIDNSAFGYCTSLTNIYVDESNKNYVSKDGVLFNKNMTELIFYPAGKNLSNYNIPNSVTSIGECAFKKCTSLVDITIPNSVTSIDVCAFYKCTSLVDITIPNSVASIDECAFADCTSLVDITIPNSVASIGKGAFEGCTLLTNIKIPNNVTYIGNSVFTDCTSLTNIAIPNSVTSIDVCAFYKCTSLKDVYYTGTQEEWNKIEIGNFNEPLTNATIHYNSTNNTNLCGENATYSFDSSTGTLTISGTGDMTDYNSGNQPWYSFKENIKKVIINDGITSIGDSAFYNCTSLVDITIPNGVTSIDDRAFEYCTSLVGITIPNSVTSIGDRAFYNCTSLVDITIPNSVTSIGESAFSNCSSLVDIIIPTSVTSINRWAFNYCTSLTSINIPTSVTSIGDCAFYNCTSLTSINIPTSVTSIGDCAFYNCTSLKDVYYTGTQEEWDKIEINKNNNEPLTNATIHYKQNDNTMVFGQDNWNFINSYMYFGKESSKTYISPKDRIKLLKSLSNTERVKVLDNLNEDWQGSCYGMSVTEILAKIGIFDVNKWNNSSHNLFELPTLDYDTNSAEESLINYYQVLQFTDLVQQELCNNLTNRKDEDIVADLLEMVSTVKTGDTPILVCYSNHAVVAYDVEDTYKVINGVKYDKKILVMDCNCTGQSDDACIYVNSSSNRWCVPYTNLSSDNQYTRMMLVTNNIELLNNKGYFETPMGYSSSDQYISVLEFNYNDNFNISKTIESNGKWINSTANGIPDGELFYNFFSNDNSNNIIAKTTLKDSLSGYSYSTEKPSEMDLNMSYKDCYLTINADSSSIVKFAPKGYISMEGKNSNYSMDMVFNEGYYSLPWSNIQLNGKNANNISMDKIDDGIIISGDNLTNVEVSAISDTVYTKVIFSTKYDKVLAYSIDDYTMGIKIDTDNNGTFETLLAQSKNFNKIKDFSIVGDINDDNQVSYIDLLLLKRYILNTEISGLDISKLDINEDSNINLFDLLDLKKCIIE